MSGAEILKIPDIIKLVKRIGLPSVQRNFVWKPSQIEDLWDSLLRGYPVGAIIAEAGDGKDLLLDGQQRITSIALGCIDLKEARKLLRSSTEDIRIFIDLRKPEIKKEGRKYAFRVITRSHPWGYQRSNNTKPIESSGKAKAIDLWSGENPLDNPFADGVLDTAYPYDAVAPFPLNIFTTAAINRKNIDEVKRELAEWLGGLPGDLGRYPLDSWLDELKRHEKRDPDVRRSAGDEQPKTYKVEEIYGEIQKMMNTNEIPMLRISANFMVEEVDESPKNDAPPENDADEEENAESDEKDDIEEVFVRLNSTGTPLGGEELSYSILKSRMDEALANLIEKKCEGVMKPARFISIAYALHQNSKDDSHAADLRVTPRQFQREMKENRKQFEEFIRNELLERDILGKVRAALKYGERGLDGFSNPVADYRLPYPLFTRIAAAGRGEIMLVLMYRLWRKGEGDVFSHGSDTHRKMLGVILLFMWLGKDSRSQYDKLVRKIWNAVKTLSRDMMWSNAIIATAWGEDGLRIPPNAKFLDPLDGAKNTFQRNTKIWDRFNKESAGYGDFLNGVMLERELALWAQRKFIATSGFFDESLFRRDDTDVPFDWDHISADSFVRNVKKTDVFQPLKDIYQTPGNLRAWPFQLNRFDSDHVPDRKFDAGWAGDKTGLLNKAFPGAADMSKQLLKSSFCEKEWCAFNEDWLESTSKGQGKKIRNDRNADRRRDVYNLIFTRWKKMYEAISRELLLANLAKEPKPLDVGCVLNQGGLDHWVFPGKKWKRREIDDGEEHRQYTVELEEGLSFYIEEFKNSPGDINFGFKEEGEKEGKDSRLKEKKHSDGENYRFTEGSDDDPHRYIYKQIDVPCLFARESYEWLLGKIAKWLKGYKCPEHREMVIEKIPEIAKYMRQSS